MERIGKLLSTISKFMGPDRTEHSIVYASLVQNASTPNLCKILTCLKPGGGYAWRTKLNPIIKEYADLGVALRADWEGSKDAVMRRAVLAKFSQNSHLKALLIGTGAKTLVEHTSRDKYWGDGGDGLDTF